ncbi:tripartite motif-containing protein 2-like isoform X2 [Arctopsyche grandis]|uniref:tripartite motif-containing protein 2-like isoform X2 n=1 Tax=Arctopsyche grandis TaxID=121162 RepID=UPI00406DA24A
MENLRRAIQTRLSGGVMARTSSTLVETVSINYEDFSESFLTCGTCLCTYDGSEHTPKLLPCSHSVCLHCLGRIAAANTRDVGSFRCPICRELITVPRGGVAALPPSFLVNQLLDLMSRQRREVVPKCSTHTNQELLFCETCDCVFCALCTSGPHSDSPCDHTIIPFSIAIKRMSEILLYKANECLSKLSSAREGVESELRRLEVAREAGAEAAATCARELTAAVERRHQELLAALSAAASHKHRMLEDQLALIDAEKAKVEQECCGLQNQIEAHDMSARITSLGERLSGAAALSEPRENAFLALEFSHNDAMHRLMEALPSLGRIRTTTTYPPLCKATIEGVPTAGLESNLILRTVDYHGVPRTSGGDPVTITATYDDNHSENLSCNINDLDNGSYRIRFRPTRAGTISIGISVVGRAIKGRTLQTEVNKLSTEDVHWGGRGSGRDQCVQPVAAEFCPSLATLYVLDAGNSRVHLLDEDLTTKDYIENEGLSGRSCTGLAVTQRGVVVVNWRTQQVTELSPGGDTLHCWSYNGFVEPVAIAVDPNYGHILVADNGARAVFVFDADGKFLFQVGGNSTPLGLIGGLCVAPGNGELLVADTAIRVFSAKGDPIATYGQIPKGKGCYGGVGVDSDGRIVVLRSEKAHTRLSVIALNSGILLTSSELSIRLRRPGAIAILPDCYVAVADLAGDCIRRYRYW